LENIFQLTEQGQFWFDAGLYLEYKAEDKAADEAEVKLLLEAPTGDLSHTLNLEFAKEIGEGADRGVNFAYAWRSRWRLTELFEPGFEAYGEFGRIDHFEALEEQEHNIGPVIAGKVDLGNTPGHIKYRIGYLFGITEASADGIAKLDLEYEFPF
jgi:hypothetical protein